MSINEHLSSCWAAVVSSVSSSSVFRASSSSLRSLLSFSALLRHIFSDSRSSWSSAICACSSRICFKALFFCTDSSSHLVGDPQTHVSFSKQVLIREFNKLMICISTFPFFSLYHICIFNSDVIQKTLNRLPHSNILHCSLHFTQFRSLAFNVFMLVSVQGPFLGLSSVNFIITGWAWGSRWMLFFLLVQTQHYNEPTCMQTSNNDSDAGAHRSKIHWLM